MYHDWSGKVAHGLPVALEETQKFPFWSRFEIMRVGVTVAVAALPLSLYAVVPSAHSPQLISATPAQKQALAGGLRTVHVTKFDLTNLGSSALADADQD